MWHIYIAYAYNLLSFFFLELWDYKKKVKHFHEAVEQQNLFPAKRKQMYTEYNVCVFLKRLVRLLKCFQ